ncbi:SDR family NAD(P)-dependent oxidoreductase [Litorivivens sp.]|uniref:SDR family NAD(P)-dependent oxidoreductase n=1 Tax=Litorivivens sp. TaxID=2020868 RepID=UPI00356259DA
MSDDTFNLSGQIAFVTGAGQGAGRAIALKLARHNVDGVAVNDFMAERAEAVAQEIRDLGVRAIAVPADVGDHGAIQRAADQTRAELGSITLLINNAGNAGPDVTMRPSPVFWETAPEEWDRYFHTNLKGVMNCCHCIIPQMVEQKTGRIVTVVSDAGRIGEARLTAYAAAKAAAAGFMRSIAKETGRYNITANCISLSTLEPALDEPTLSEFLRSDQAKAHVGRYVIRRFGKPDDVANMTLFLCSEAGSWITGQTYPVNGGYSFSL